MAFQIYYRREKYSSLTKGITATAMLAKSYSCNNKKSKLQHAKTEKHQKDGQHKGKRKATRTYLDGLIANKKSKQSLFEKKCKALLVADIPMSKVENQPRKDF